MLPSIMFFNVTLKKRNLRFQLCSSVAIMLVTMPLKFSHSLSPANQR